MNQTTLIVYSQFNDFLELAKPRIGVLVLITAFAGMYIAAGSHLSIGLVLVTLVGVGLASFSSGMLNNYIDREVDKRMDRTRERALPSARVDPQQVLLAALALSAISFITLSTFVNLLTACLTLFTVFFYVVIYTIWLKRVSPWCTEIGGVAGALPPLIGWTAVTNSIGWQALTLVLLLFLWQPPHFWALALLRKDEYRQAGLPMLPVVRGERATKLRMLLYTLTLLPLCVFIYLANIAGPIFLLTSLIFNAIYLLKTLQFCLRPLTPGGARELFGISIVYIAVIFTMIFFDGVPLYTMQGVGT